MLNKVYGYSVKAHVNLAYDDLTWNLRLTEFRWVLKELKYLLVII
jgi:hypothetical protein